MKGEELDYDASKLLLSLLCQSCFCTLERQNNEKQTVTLFFAGHQRSHMHIAAFGTQKAFGSFRRCPQILILIIADSPSGPHSTSHHFPQPILHTCTMADEKADLDPLILLRQAISSDVSPISTTSAEPAGPSSIEKDLAKATHLQFNHVGHKVLPLDSPTRFELSGEPVDLRSIFFAWLNKDQPSQEYIAATQKLNNDLSAATGAGGEVKNLVFAEKLDLLTWLERASNESEFIKPLAADKQAADADVGAEIAAGVRDGASTSQIVPVGGRLGRKIDPRLREIYNGERRMGDRNSILHGVKPTVSRQTSRSSSTMLTHLQDFSHVRKQAALFLKEAKAKGARPNAMPSSTNTNGAMTPNSRAKSSRRQDPIILLSPSESSLLRITNIKSFLEDGVYTPPKMTAERPDMLATSRRLPSIDPHRPLRFALTESAEKFKLEDWPRLVAVFTTGQPWQFREYHWSSPPELFSHALGIYVGWRGEKLDDKHRAQVDEWGRGVLKTQIDKHNPEQLVQARWRDREVVEGIWTAIEESMRAKGFNKDGSLNRR